MPGSRRSRRRLAAAAVASLALHLLLARGLALTSLGLDGSRPATAAAAERKPKRQVDFTIRVSKSPAARPAHERPQTIASAAPAANREMPRPTARAATARDDDAPADRLPMPIAATDPTPARDRDLPSGAAPARAAAAAAPAASAQAEAVQADAAGRSDAGAAPAAVPRSRDAAAATSSRWRPREVALLERLTAPAARRPAAVRDGLDGDLATVAPAGRAVVDATAAPAAAAPATAPAGNLDTPLTAGPADRTATRDAVRAAVGPRGSVAPADRLTPSPARATGDLAAARGRREASGTNGAGAAAPGRRTSTASGPSATADALAGSVAADAAESSGAAAGPANAPPRRGGGGAGIAGASQAGPRAASDGDQSDRGGGALAGSLAPPAPRVGRGRAAAAEGSVAGSVSTPTRAAVAVGGAAGDAGSVPEAGGGTAASWVPSVAPGPRTVGNVATGGGTRPTATVARSALGATAGTDDDAELSVPRGVTAHPRSAGRADDADSAPQSPRAPERVAAIALPAETRVRDVAEAFARRGRDARPDRRGDPRAARADAVVDRGLDFLARAQQADGRWSLGRFAGSGPADVPELASDTAATGLALLAFLGAGHDHFDGPHRDSVRRGLEFLLAVQKADGDLYRPADDLSNSCAWLYSHGIASIALCEAVGMTGDPLVKPAAAKACGFIAASQHPDRGGWRYLPRSDADLSVSGWMLVALRSGDLAGVETDSRALAGVRTLLDAAASAADPARYAYNPRKPEQRASELSGLCMTAVGALMRLHTGAKPDDPRVVAAARVLAARPPAYDARSRDSYLWYYASQVLVHSGGAEWDAWYAALVETLAAAQETAGPRAGSWDPLGPRPDRWGRFGGRIYVTALHLLALEVPDRRLPTYTARE
jgi:hypothetical protein